MFDLLLLSYSLRLKVSCNICTQKNSSWYMKWSTLDFYSPCMWHGHLITVDNAVEGKKMPNYKSGSWIWHAIASN